MKVVGLVVEYNPLHYGHAYHFQQAKQEIAADAVVIIMSGHFLQRGEPAIVNKWTRAKMALAMGVDIVLELPYIYSTQPAERFALGAIASLNQLPFITHLCFGSESGELSQLKQVADIVTEEPNTLKECLKEHLNQGLSYPHAYAHALAHTLRNDPNYDTKTMSQPNNILGLSYLIALNKTGSSIHPYTVQRIKADYHDKAFKDKQIASATSIREALFNHKKPKWDEIDAYVPPFTLALLQEEYEAGRGLIHWETYFPLLLQTILSSSPEQLAAIHEVEEGIEYRIKEQALYAESFADLCMRIKTKRYTHNRIQRMMTHILLQVTKQEYNHLSSDQPAYLRLLGYSEQGRTLINQYKKKIDIPLIVNIQRDAPESLQLDVRASAIYSLGYGEKDPLYRRQELWEKPVSQVKKEAIHLAH